MRRIIDGHVHLIPRRTPGWKDPVAGKTILPNGMLLGPDGGARRFLPAYVEDSCFPLERLMAVLDDQQVEKAVIMAHLEYEVGETAVEAIGRYPQRLAAAVCVAPREGCVDQLDHWHEQGIRILKFEMRSLNELYPGITLEDPNVEALVGRAEELGMIVAVDPSPSTFPSYRPDCMERMVQRHPGLRVVICHMGFPYAAMRQEPAVYDRWRQMIRVLRHGNVWMDVTAMPDLFQEEDFPYPSAMTYLREIYEQYGAGKLIWGTDIPGTLCRATYRQMVTAFERADFLTEEDKDRLFFANANALYFA